MADRKVIEHELARQLNQVAAQTNIFADDKAVHMAKGGPKYRDVLQKMTDVLIQDYDKEKLSEETRRISGELQQIHTAAILFDVSGEGYIYQILAYGMEEFDFEGTDDFGGIITKMGFSVDDFRNSDRLRRGMYKVFRLHYPKSLERPEYFLLFIGLDKGETELDQMVMETIAAVRGVGPEKITADDLIKVMDDNNEILNLYRELGKCVTLAVTFPNDDVLNNEEDRKEIYLAIVANDPAQGGALMWFHDGWYELQQYVTDILGQRELHSKVARLNSTDRAKQTAMRMFDHPEDSEKTLRIPLSTTSYAETVYPFEEYKVCDPEGDEGELSGSQKVCYFEMSMFFDQMSEESRQYLRDARI